jgi:hypothetical protein
MKPVPEFLIACTKPAPAVATSSNVTVKVPEVQSIRRPRSTAVVV